MKIKVALDKHHDCAIEVKPSTRAKYLRLKIDREGKVQMVLPKGYSLENARQFANAKKAWIAKTLAELQQQPLRPIELPTALTLLAAGEKWSIDYHKTEDVNLHYLTDLATQHIQLSGKVDDHELVFRYLDQWLKEQGKRLLPNMLTQVSLTTGLAYNRVSIRKQKTRWGSCSTKKNISLNCKLLFFPKSVADYVMVHELCHTQEMNHSKRFWSLVEQHDPEYRQHEMMLKNSKNYIPHGI